MKKPPPEAAEVKLNADFLNKAFNGKIISGITINSGKYKTKKLLKGWWEVKEDIFFFGGAEIKNVKSKGKLLYGEIHYLSSRVNRVHYFICSLGMSGFWTNKELKHNHITFVIKNGADSIHFNDARRFGNLEFFHKKEQLDKKLDTLGVDFFDDSLFNQVYSPKISARIDKIKPETQICQVLMDQRIFCGVGNYIKCEALYACGIHPAREWKDIDNKDLWYLFTACDQVIQKAYEAQGAAFKSFKDSDGNLKGQFSNQFKVYGRKTTDQGYEIIKETFNDKRTTHFCPKIQK